MPKPNPLFQFDPQDTLDNASFYDELERLAQDDPAGQGEDGRSDRPAVLERGIKAAAPSSLADQFIVFQMNPSAEGQTILEASQVDPELEGANEIPDVNVDIQLQSFHLANNEDVDRDSRVTMRLVMGKDSNSRDRFFDDVFWTVSAGLNLYNEAKRQPTKPHEFKADLSEALGKRPIEIPGGLANMTFEIVLHKNPEWWQRIFGFLQTTTGQQLTSVLGFPALTQNAIKVVDEVLNRFDRNKSKALFKSRSMVLALSQQAKMDYTAGNPRIRMGSLNPGFCIMARGGDYQTIAKSNAFYYPHYGILVPADVHPQDIVGKNYDDPFVNVTYAVFRVGMTATRLNQQLYYGNPMV